MITVYDINLVGGPRHGFNVTLGRLPEWLALPDADVDVYGARIDLGCPPYPVHRYELAVEMISSRGLYYATYQYVVTRFPDGSEKRISAIDAPPVAPPAGDDAPEWHPV